MVHSSFIEGYNTQLQYGGACVKSTTNYQLLGIDQRNVAEIFFIYYITRGNKQSKKYYYMVHAFQQCCTEIKIVQIAQNKKTVMHLPEMTKCQIFLSEIKACGSVINIYWQNISETKPKKQL